MIFHLIHLSLHVSKPVPMDYSKQFWPSQFWLTFANNIINYRKCGNCECVATWGRPSHASPFPL